MSLPWRVARSLPRPGRRHAYGPDPGQVGELHLPRGQGRHPVVVLLHGGHWQTRFGRLVCRPLALDLVGRGWAAWNLEYRRLGPGRGGGGGWPATFEDVAAGLDHLAALDGPRLDLGRVVLVGHSAGGQLALWAAGRGPGTVGGAAAVPLRRVVALSPVTDMAGAGRAARALLGGPPKQFPGRWAEADPCRSLPPPVPVLVVHPEGDRTVSVRQSAEYVRRCRDAGGDVQLVAPADEGHRAPIDPGSACWAAAAAWLGPGSP